MSFLFTYTAAALAIFFVLAAAFLFFQGRRDTLANIFTFYLLSSALWIGGNAAADISHAPDTLIITSGIAFIGGALIVSAFLIFVDTFIDGKLPPSSRLWLYSLPTFLFIVFSFSEYAIVETAFPADQPAQITPGFLYQLGFVWLVGSLSYGLFRLAKEARRSHGKRHLQTIYIIIGFSGLLLGEMVFSVFLPLLGELRYFNVAPQFSLIFVIACGYAIFRHNLLDIRIVIQRSFIFSLLSVGIVGAYLLILYTFTALFQSYVTQLELMSAGITTIIGIFSVPYIEMYLRKKTDHFFFKDRYNYASSLYSLSERINKKLLLGEVVEQTELALEQLFKTNKVTVRIFVKNPTVTAQPTEHKNPIIYIHHNGSIIGSIELSKKLSGDLYTDEDIALLNTFSNQVAVAIENARLFKEVEDYSNELEKRVAERTEEIVKLQEEQTEIILDISHKLQNPLTILKNELSLLQKQTDQKAQMTFFERTLDDVSAFTYDLLHITHLDRRAIDTAKETINVSDLLFELIEYFEVITTQRGIRLNHSITPDILFYCNKKEITELCTNLVSNAVKYIGEVKETECKTVTITLKHNGETIQLSVADNGIGISQTDLPNIFKRFYRSHNRHGEVSGTGLGLAICKKIVEIHGGDISVESTKDIGATFICRFPVTS